jgi:TrkA-C domain
LLDMVALVSFLLILTLSLIIERVATVALTLTGLSRDAARFQARSAFTGTGFTTAEAEWVVGDPARRRIIMLLMGMRSFEIITGVSALVLSFAGVGSTREGVVRGLWLSAGIVALGLAASSGWVDRHLSRAIAWALRRWTTLDVRDYTTLLGLTAGHGVLEMPIAAESWMADRRLDELDLPEEGVTVLAIQRPDGSFVGAPHNATVIRPRDTLILYGRAERLAEIGGRRSGAGGDQAHRDAVDAQRQVLVDQDRREHLRQEHPRDPHDRHDRQTPVGAAAEHPESTPRTRSRRSRRGLGRGLEFAVTSAVNRS